MSSPFQFPASARPPAHGTGAVMNDTTQPTTAPSLDPFASIRCRAVISVEETAALLGLGRSQTYAAVRAGELPSRRIGRRVLIPVPLLLEYLGDRGAAA